MCGVFYTRVPSWFVPRVNFYFCTCSTHECDTHVTFKLVVICITGIIVNEVYDC